MGRIRRKGSGKAIKSAYGHNAKGRTAEEVAIAAAYNRMLWRVTDDDDVMVTFSPGLGVPVRWDGKSEIALDPADIRAEKLDRTFGPDNPEGAPWLHGYVMREAGRVKHSERKTPNIAPAEAAAYLALEEVRQVARIIDERPQDRRWLRAGM